MLSVQFEDDAQPVTVPLNVLPIGQFAKIQGWSYRKTYSKVQRMWTDGVEYFYADGEIYVDIEAVNQWAKSRPGKGCGNAKRASKSTSTTKTSDTGSPSSTVSRPRRL